MTLRDIASDVSRRQEPALAQDQIWAERAKRLRTDQLTGLSNQFGWDEALDEAMFTASRFAAPLVVARIDLDTPAAGCVGTTGPTIPTQPRQPLVSFATRARRVVRNGDLFARLDGDVLVVALTRCPAAVAVQILQRICSSVGQGETCSVGWAVWDRQESPQVLMERAGQALDFAQARGGNQIVAAV